MLLNRVIWLGVSAAMLVAAHLLFRTQRPASRKRAARARERADPKPPAPRELVVASRAGRRAARSTAAPSFRQFLHQLRFDAASVLKSLPFLILLGLGLVNLIGSARLPNRLFGTDVHPVTALMMEAMRGSYQFLLLLIVAYYAGEVIWRERDARIAEVDRCDAGAELGAAAREDRRAVRRRARVHARSASWQRSSTSCRRVTRTSSSASTCAPCCWIRCRSC